LHDFASVHKIVRSVAIAAVFILAPLDPGESL